MASNTISTKIQIEGEQQYKQNIKEIVQQSKLLSSEMKALTTSFNNNDKSIKNNTKVREQLNKQIQLQKKAVQENAQMMQKYAMEIEKTDNPSKELTRNMEEYARKANLAQAELNKLENQLANMPTTLDLVGSKFKEVGEKMTNIGKSWSTYISAPIVALGGASVKQAMNFEDAMAKVNTIADTTEVPLKQLEQQILDLSDSMGVGAGEIAEGVYSAISAGQDTADAVNFVAQANKLAIAGFTDTANATDVLTTALNAYGMEASEVNHVADVLIQTQNLGKTTVDELSASMGKVIPTANLAGVSFEKLSAMFAILTKNGVSTRISTTWLNAMLGELGATGSDVDKIMHEMTGHLKEGGMSFTEMMEQGWELSDALGLLDEYASNTGQTLADLFSSDIAGRGAVVLQKSADELNEFSDAMYNASDGAGATETAFEKMQTTSFKMNRAMNQIKNSAIALGNTILEMLMPYIEKTVEKVEQFTTWFNNLDSSTKKLIVTIGAIVASIGPLLIIFGTLAKVTGTIMLGAKAIGTAFLFLNSTLIPIIAVIGLIVGACVLLYQNWDLIKLKAIELKDALVEAWTNIKEYISVKITEIVESVGQMVANMATAVLAHIEIWKSAISQLIQGAVDKIAEFFTGMYDKGADLINKFIEGAKSVASQVKDIGANIVNGVWEGIQSKIGEFTTNVSNFFSNIVDNVKNNLGISSPSKVFAEIGKFMGQGLELGWAREIRNFNPSADLSLRVPSVNSVAGITGNVGSNYSFNPTINLNGDYHERDGMNIALSLDRWLGSQVG